MPLYTGVAAGVSRVEPKAPEEARAERASERAWHLRVQGLQASLSACQAELALALKENRELREALEEKRRADGRDLRRDLQVRADRSPLSGRRRRPSQ